MGDWSWLSMLVVVLAVAMVVSWFFRRWWLARQPGAFDCDLFGKQPGDWAMGVARLRGSSFEWFSSFSLKPWPTLRLSRVRATASHDTTAEPSMLHLGQDMWIVGIESAAAQQSYTFAVKRESAMALLSWFEAAPPGSCYDDLEL